MQDNFEYDKKIKSELQEKLQLPKEVKEKIQKTYEELEKSEMNKKDIEKRSKFKLSKILSIAASFVLVVFLAGNGIAFAKGEDNIYSWILEKIGIQKEYEEIKTEVDETVESNGFKITVLDIGYDENMFIVGYKIEDINGKIKNLNEEYKKTLSEEEQATQIENNTGIWDSLFIDVYYKFYTKDSKEFAMHKDEDSISLGETDINFPEFNIIKNSENEYFLYEVYDFSKYNIIKGEIRDIKIYIDSIKALGYNFSQSTGDEDNIIARGLWDFSIRNIETDYRNNKNYSMNINKEIDRTIRINEVKLIDGNMLDFIKVDAEIIDSNKDEYEIFNKIAKYGISILDSNNNVVGEYPTITLAGDINKEYIRINNLDMNEKYKMQISIYDEKMEDFKIIDNIELDCFIVDDN